MGPAVVAGWRTGRGLHTAPFHNVGGRLRLQPTRRKAAPTSHVVVGAERTALVVPNDPVPLILAGMGLIALGVTIALTK